MQARFALTTLAAAAATARILAACGGSGGNDSSTSGGTTTDTGGGTSTNTPGGTTTTAFLPAPMDFDAREELLRPGATVPLQVELADASGRNVSNPAAANVQVSILSDTTGGARLSASQLATVNGDANFTITLGAAAGTTIVQATTDRSDNNVTNGISSPLSWLLGMVVTAYGNGLNWDTPASVTLAPGGRVQLEDANDGAEPYTYTIQGAAANAGITLSTALRDDDPILTVPASTARGTYAATLQVTDRMGAVLQMPMTIVVQ